jgi:hypothetical protein
MFVPSFNADKWIMAMHDEHNSIEANDSFGVGMSHLEGNVRVSWIGLISSDRLVHATDRRICCLVRQPLQNSN